MKKIVKSKSAEKLMPGQIVQASILPSTLTNPVWQQLLYAFIQKCFKPEPMLILTQVKQLLEYKFF